MMLGRQAFGICHIGNFIYVAGGGSSEGYLKSCEQYNILENKWITIPDLPYTSFAMNLITVLNRWIFGFGMMKPE